MSKPEYVKVDEKLYKINTDFRVALECNKIALDESIGNVERALAILYKLFGEAGIDCENKDKLLELGIRYIHLGREQKSLKTQSDEKYEIDFEKSKGLISSSFKYDYKYDPFELEYLHWYDFYNDLENLSSSELGDCCILNRIINILNQDASKIKDNKARQKMVDAQELIKEMYCRNTEKKKMTKEQEQSAKEFYKEFGIEW